MEAGSRRRRGWDVDILWRRVAAAGTWKFCLDRRYARSAAERERWIDAVNGTQREAPRTVGARERARLAPADGGATPPGTAEDTLARATPPRTVGARERARLAPADGGAALAAVDAQDLRASLVEAVATPLRELRGDIEALAASPAAAAKLDALLERVEELRPGAASPHEARIEALREGLETRIESLRGDVAALGARTPAHADAVDAAALARAVANVEWKLDKDLLTCLERVVLRAGFLRPRADDGGWADERLYTLHACLFDASGVA